MTRPIIGGHMGNDADIARKLYFKTESSQPAPHPYCLTVYNFVQLIPFYIGFTLICNKKIQCFYDCDSTIGMRKFKDLILGSKII